jgi:hypothetical protein
MTRDRAEGKGGDADEHPKRRVYLQASPNQEGTRRERCEALVLSKEQPRHEKAAEHEEQIDANPAASDPKPGEGRYPRVSRRELEARRRHVPTEDEQDRQGSKRVEHARARRG